MTSTKTDQPILHPITLSLFSGAGGLDIGFHRAGFEIVACVELEESFAKTLHLNAENYLAPNCQILNQDIRTVTPDDLEVQHVDFIIGGPPCQSFSAIGRRAGGVDGVNDERGGLFQHYCRLVQHFQPRGFLFENVRGILGANAGYDWQRITAAFENIGYHLSYRVLDSADYGVPQHRERLLMIGTRSGRIKFPRPTHGPDSAMQRPYVTAIEAIADLQDPEEPEHHYSGKHGHLLEEVPPGQNYHYFTKEMGYPNPHFAWRSRFSDFLYKADPDKPVRTIVAQLGAYSGPFHWKNRKFKLEEFKRLQAFPDDYQFAGGTTSALRQIGNSVPPAFAERLARAVRQQLFGVNLEVELLDYEHELSFDTRKSSKARRTRAARHNTSINAVPTLFSETSIIEFPNVQYHKDIYWHYLSRKKRVALSSQKGKINDGVKYHVSVDRVNEKCSIKVERYEKGVYLQTPLLRYDINFHHAIGDGLKEIICTLYSYNVEDIPVVWDAIEDYLSSSSGYSTMMDIFGHFTEPHPVFDLHFEVLTNTSSFMLRFAEMFSKFSATTKVLPGATLEKLYQQEDGPFDLATIARQLRALRFDVRVHETNTTIPQHHFRCCYPFTININKQVSVTWQERGSQ